MLHNDGNIYFSRLRYARHAASRQAMMASLGVEAGTALTADVARTDGSKQPEEKKLQFGVVYIEDGVEDDDDDEEEYTIEYVSGGGATSTLDRVMEAWMERVQTESGNGQYDKRMPLPQSPIEQRNQILLEARQWFNGCQPAKNEERWWMPTFTRSQQFATITGANKILKALAKANKTAPCPSIEALAGQILDFVSASDEKANIETYNAYFECMDGSVAHRRANKIEEKMAELVNKAKKKPHAPKPNAETIDIAIRAWSEVGGKNSIDAIGKLMKSPPCCKFSPTRETYSALLAAAGTQSTALVCSSRLFNRDTAKQIMEQIQAASIQENDESLRPDTDLFNIPIVSKSFANHETLYGSSDLWTENIVLSEEAASIEEWVKDMSQGDNVLVRPNIATIEALIHAWVKTGTKDGIEKAETWASSALAEASAELGGPIQPSLQTFHPILASYAFTGQPAKLKDWIGRLEAVGGSCNPDSRLRALEITAHMHALRRGLKQGLDQPSDADLTEHAEGCSSLLRNLVSDVVKFHEGKSSEPLFLDAVAFVETVKAWGHLSCFRRESGGDFEYCAQQALEVQKLFESTIRDMGTISTEHISSEYTTLQLAHLRFMAPQLYVTTANVFHETVMNLEESRVTLYTKVIDSMLRSAAEHGRELQKLSTRQHLTGEVMYLDMYTYHPKLHEFPYHEEVLDFCLRVANQCTQSSASTANQSELVQLCNLILKLHFSVASSSERKTMTRTTHLFKSISEVFLAVESREERAGLLNHLLETVKASPNHAEAEFTEELETATSLIRGVRRKSDGRSDAQLKPELTISGTPKQNVTPTAGGAVRTKEKVYPISGGTKRIHRKGPTRARPPRFSSASSA
jgi:hypothetical protein